MKKIQFRNVTAVKRELSNVYNDYKTGKIKQAQAHQLTYILKSLLQACSMIWEQKMILKEEKLEEEMEGYG